MLTLLSALGLSLPLVAGTPPPAQTAVTANNQFAIDLYQQLCGRDGNLFFSPFSISKALAMTYAGARGETAREMAAVLHLPADQDQAHLGFLEMRRQINRNLSSMPPTVGHPVAVKPGFQIGLAAALWGQKGYGFAPSFLQRLRECYDAGLNEIDFRNGEQARQAINAWASGQTAGRIPELLAMPPDILTRLVLVSAIYFKGDWANPFQKDCTRPEPFHVGRGREVAVPMMSQTETFGYAEADGLQLLEMPYDGKTLGMLVVLPREVDGLAGVERALTKERLAAWTARLHEHRVQVSFPCFKMTSGLALPQTLKAMGMKTPFDRGAADFGGMNGGREPIWISDVVHKAFIDVNEAGTEAAAATAVTTMAGAAPGMGRPVIPEFRADRPFLFAIREVGTGAILFLGRYTQP